MLQVARNDQSRPPQLTGRKAQSGNRRGPRYLRTRTKYTSHRPPAGSFRCSLPRLSLQCYRRLPFLVRLPRRGALVRRHGPDLSHPRYLPHPVRSRIWIYQNIGHQQRAQTECESCLCHLRLRRYGMEKTVREWFGWEWLWTGIWIRRLSLGWWLRKWKKFEGLSIILLLLL